MMNAALPFHQGKAPPPPRTPGTAAAHPPHQPRTAPGTRTTPLYAHQTFEKYASCRDGVAGGSPFHVRRPHPLKEQRERGRQTLLSNPPATKSQKQKQKQRSKTKVKVKVKVKVKTITGTGAAKGAGQTRLRYRSSKRRGLNQPAAKTTGETEHVKPALARGRQAVYVGPILRRPLTGTRRPEGNEQPKGPDGATSRPPAVQSRGVYSSCGLTSAWP